MPYAFTAIEPAAIDRLVEFLDATGWIAIYGLNLGTGSPERNMEEAAYVARKLVSRLLYFQIGNEPEYYRDANNRLRPHDFPYCSRNSLAWRSLVISVSYSHIFGSTEGVFPF
jgi:hypothetical protein